MKKFFLLVVIFLSPVVVFASEKETVTLEKCVDGDTASVILNKKKIKVRFLAVDTPESVHPKKEVEPFGKEASEYTCNKLTNADKIEIEYDPNSDKTDKYDRHLVWIYTDGVLLQKELVSKGYAKVAYLYNDYLYTDELEQAELKAKKDNLGIWGDYKKSDYLTDLFTSIMSFFEAIIDFILDVLAIFE